jgi:hypothetical protein
MGRRVKPGGDEWEDLAGANKHEDGRDKQGHARP